MDTATGNCESCSTVCSSCSGPGKASCDSNYCTWPAHVRADGADGCACPADMTASATDRYNPCYCTDSTKTFDYSSGQCVNNDTGCVDGYYMANGTCTRCEWPCTSCTTADECQQCDGLFVPTTNSAAIEPNLKNCACPDGQYFEHATLECLACTSPCTTCTGPNTCASCNDYRTEESGACVCKDDTPDTSARSVVSDHDRAEFFGYQALIDSNTYDGTVCSDFCAEEDICLVYTACPNDGYYRDEHTAECLPCDSSCTECVGPNWAHCTACPHGTHLETWSVDVQYGGCRCDKTSHYYEAATGECLPCGSACTSCRDGQTCMACNDFSTLDMGVGQCYCDDSTAALTENCVPNVTVGPQYCLTSE